MPFAEAFAKVQQIESLVACVGPLWRLYFPRELKPSLKVLEDFVQPIIEQALKECESGIEISKTSNFTQSLSQYTSDKMMMRGSVD